MLWILITIKVLVRGISSEDHSDQGRWNSNELCQPNAHKNHSYTALKGNKDIPQSNIMISQTVALFAQWKLSWNTISSQRTSLKLSFVVQNQKQLSGVSYYLKNSKNFYIGSGYKIFTKASFLYEHRKMAHVSRRKYTAAKQGLKTKQSCGKIVSITFCLPFGWSYIRVLVNHQIWYVLSEEVSTLGWSTVKELKSGNCLLIIHLPAVLSQESEWYNFHIPHLQCPSVIPSTGSEKSSISIPGGCQCWREAEKRKASRWRAAITAEIGFVTTRGSHHCIVLESLTVSYHLCLFKRERERDRKRDKWRGRDRESI